MLTRSQSRFSASPPGCPFPTAPPGAHGEQLRANGRWTSASRKKMLHNLFVLTPLWWNNFSFCVFLFLGSGKHNWKGTLFLHALRTILDLWCLSWLCCFYFNQKGETVKKMREEVSFGYGTNIFLSLWKTSYINAVQSRLSSSGLFTNVCLRSIDLHVCTTLPLRGQAQHSENSTVHCSLHMQHKPLKCCALIVCVKKKKKYFSLA